MKEKGFLDHGMDPRYSLQLLAEHKMNWIKLNTCSKCRIIPCRRKPVNGLLPAFYSIEVQAQDLQFPFEANYPWQLCLQIGLPSPAFGTIYLAASHDP